MPRREPLVEHSGSVQNGKGKPPPLTEGQLVERVRSRYEGDSGNGPAGCLVPQVRNQAGFDASRTIDALGFHFWPSRGLLIDAYECKSSRSDWTREVETPEKADAFCRLADRFYVVVGRADLAKVDEVPLDWGLLVPHGDKLKEVKPAVVLHQDSPAIIEWAARATGGRRAAGPRPLPPGFDRSFLVAIIRQAYKVTKVTPEEIDAARVRGLAEGRESAERTSKAYEPMYQELSDTVREFERGLGHSIRGYRWSGGRSAKEVGAALRVILEGEHNVDGLRNRLRAAADSAEKIAEEARRQIEALDRIDTEAQTRLEIA